MDFFSEGDIPVDTSVEDGAADAMRREASGSPLYKDFFNQPTTKQPLSLTELLMKGSIYAAAATVSPAAASALVSYEMQPSRLAPGQYELVPLDQQERNPFPLYLFE